MGVQRSVTTPMGRQQRMAEPDSASFIVKVLLMGELKRLAGRREVLLELPVGSTVHALASELGRVCDPAFGRLALSKEGDLQSHVAVFLNGAQLESMDGLPAPLTGGDIELMLVPMYEGG
jgi:molybdopterin converting factor small subunit